MRLRPLLLRGPLLAGGGLLAAAGLHVAWGRGSAFPAPDRATLAEAVIGAPPPAAHDQGPGVPEKDRTVVFQKYRRGGAAERMPGAGLGLAIVKSIVDLHHGSAHVETAPGGGALFVVELPCKPTSA